MKPAWTSGTTPICAPRPLDRAVGDICPGRRKEALPRQPIMIEKTIEACACEVHAVVPNKKQHSRSIVPRKRETLPGETAPEVGRTAAMSSPPCSSSGNALLLHESCLHSTHDSDLQRLQARQEKLAPAPLRSDTGMPLCPDADVSLLPSL